MAKVQTRKSISVRGTTYEHLRLHCESRGIAVSQYVEDLIEGGIGPAPIPSPSEPAPRPARQAPQPVAAAVAVPPPAPLPPAGRPRRPLGDVGAPSSMLRRPLPAPRVSPPPEPLPPPPRHTTAVRSQPMEPKGDPAKTVEGMERRRLAGQIFAF